MDSNRVNLEWGTIQHKDTLELKRYWVDAHYPWNMIAVCGPDTPFSDACDREGMEKNWKFYPFKRIEDVFFEQQNINV